MSDQQSSSKVEPSSPGRRTLVKGMAAMGRESRLSLS